MNRLFLTFATVTIAAASLFAQTDTPSFYLAPAGIWPVCQSAPQVSDFCRGYRPGSETYILLIKGGPAEVVAYRYRVSVTLEDGSTRTFAGAIERNGDGVATVPIPTMGIILQNSITVEYLCVLVR
jgi:hypothetical protein